MKKHSLSVIFIIILLYLLMFEESFAQTFNLPGEVCPGESITFTSPQPTAPMHQWDFCTGDLLQTPEAALVVNPIVNAHDPIGIQVVFDGENWLGFMVNISNNFITRFNFGNSLENTPTYTNLFVSPASLMTFLNDFVFRKEQGNWYALSTRNVSPNLVRFNFGNSLLNTPTVVGLTNPTSFPLSVTRGIDYVYRDNKIYLYVQNDWNGGNDRRFSVIRLNDFTSDFTNDDIIQTNYNFNNTTMSGLSIIEDNNNIYGIASGINKVLHLNFGSNPFSLPIVTDITNLIGNQEYRKVKIIKDGNSFIAHLVTTSGNIIRYNFGASMSNTSPVATNLGNFGLIGSQTMSNRPSIAFTMAQQGSEWYAFTINRHPNINPPFNQHQLVRLKFPNPCNANIPTSSSTNPVANYVLPGNYAINLRTFDTNGNFDKIYTDNLTVKQATVGNFTFTNQCLGENTIFNNLSIGGDATVGSWEWDFGDGSPKSNLRSPIYKYPRAGIFNASLKVTNTTGCVNTTTKPLIVSSRPKPDFTTQSGTCLAEPVTFRDLSTWQPITPVITYLWDFGDGVGVLRGNASDATTRNPSYTYNAPGIYNVTLSLFEGNPTNCAGSISRQIVVAPKPVANFNFTNLCVNAPTQFTDASTLVGNWNDNIVAWDWNFSGRGTSKERNPRFIFTATGTFNVTLTATTRYGCQHTITRSLTIQPSATSSFTTDITQGNAPLTVRFNNTSVGASTYLWEFGDGNTSTQPSLTYTFNKQGVYDVGFQARGANGCGTIATRQITVFAPLLDITLNNLLVNEQGEMTVNIVNKSSFPLTEINLQIKIGQNNEVMQEIWQGFILPTKEQTYTLKKKVTAEQISQNAFICLTASTVNQLEDTNVSDNTACFKILQSFEVLGFSPIPADNLITINYYIPDDTKPVELKVFSSVGALVRTYTLPVQVKDTNFYYFDANYLSNGVYYFHFLHNGNRIVKKAMIFR